MPSGAKKLMQNQALGLSMRVTEERLRNAGIQLVKPQPRTSPQGEIRLKVPPRLTKRLAGS